MLLVCWFSSTNLWSLSRAFWKHVILGVKTLLQPTEAIIARLSVLMRRWKLDISSTLFSIKPWNHHFRWQRKYPTIGVGDGDIIENYKFLKLKYKNGKKSLSIVSGTFFLGERPSDLILGPTLSINNKKW